MPESAESQALIKTMWEAGKIVAAVCHGPIALINVTLSDETKLLAGKKCTGEHPRAPITRTTRVHKPRAPPARTQRAASC